MPSVIKNKPSVSGPEEIDESTGPDQAASLQRLENVREHINTLTKRWEDVEIGIRNQRLMRRCRVDVEAARKDNKMQEGDIFIGVRTIDNNITMSLPTHVAYIKQSPRQAVFVANGTPTQTPVLKNLESEYTRVMRYPMWEFDYIRLFDASEFFGWGWVEVLYDRTKPGMVAVNHVGTEDLIFDTSIGNIQHSRVVLRRYRPTLVTLLELAQKNGFDKTLVKKLKQKIRDNSKNPHPGNDSASTDISAGCVTLYKVHFKEGGKVFTSWYTPDCDDKWLRDPRLFWNGIKEQTTTFQADPMTGQQIPIQNWERVPETEYPFRIMLKKVTEDDEITQTQGRGEMDQHLQQAQTSVFSAYVTQTWRSSRQIWAPKQPDTSRAGGTAPKQSSMKLIDNALWDQPMESFTPAPPDSTVPIALDKLATQNADNLNQPAFTVVNRQNDSRKTAKEVEVASQQNAQITSTQVVVSSVCIAAIQTAAWRIVQSQALQGNIIFLSSDGTPAGNDTQTIGADYTLQPAGDVDFIERQETEQKMQQDWPIVATTPMALPFLTDYLRLRYPKQADGWLQQMQAQSPERAALAALIPIVEELAVDDAGNPEPEVQPMMEQLQQILANAKQLLQTPPNGQQPGNTAAAPQAMGQPAPDTGTDPNDTESV